jgi:hypothetical protein
MKDRDEISFFCIQKSSLHSTSTKEAVSPPVHPFGIFVETQLAIGVGFISGFSILSSFYVSFYANMMLF